MMKINPWHVFEVYLYDDAAHAGHVINVIITNQLVRNRVISYCFRGVEVFLKVLSAAQVERHSEFPPNY